MTNYTLYRKEIEMLEIVKNRFSAGHYHGGYRESIDELFFENREHLRADFLELIPVDKLENVKELLFLLKTVAASTSGRNSTIGSAYDRERRVSDVIEEITALQELIKTECNRRFRFGVFYSWQSDTDSKLNRNFIEDAIEKAIKWVNKDASEGPLLAIDKDTRGVPGSPDIVNAILQKID